MTENLPRRHQKIFAKNAGAQGTTVYGSTAAGNTQYATDIGMLQSDAWETGLVAGVITDNAPVLQDDNTVKKVVTQQLAYLFQKGIPEWEGQTIYFKGNLCMFIIDGIPNLYYSLIDNNLNNNPLNSNNSWKKLQLSSQIIGQIISVVSSSNYIPSGCLPCDGSEYNKTQFIELWNNYLTASTPLLQTCTYEEYQQDITTYGQCIKFAVNTSKNTFKTPTIKDGSYITQAESDSELGKSYNESLPNIRAKSYSVSVGTTGNVDNSTVISGAYEIDTSITTKNINSGTSSTSHSLSLNASLSSSTYQDGAKVQGDNVRLRFFVVVTNGEINQSQMDWSAWATGLNGKANTDLSNTASNIDYVIERGSNENGWYEKWKSGKIKQGGVTTNLNNTIQTFNFPTPFVDTNYNIIGSIFFASNLTNENFFIFV